MTTYRWQLFPRAEKRESLQSRALSFMPIIEDDQMENQRIGASMRQNLNFAQLELGKLLHLAVVDKNVLVVGMVIGFGWPVDGSLVQLRTSTNEDRGTLLLVDWNFHLFFLHKYIVTSLYCSSCLTIFINIIILKLTHSPKVVHRLIRGRLTSNELTIHWLHLDKVGMVIIRSGWHVQSEHDTKKSRD